MISGIAWGTVAYSAITSLAEADMALAFEYYLDTDYSFNTVFQKTLAGFLSESYMEYINAQNLSVEEAQDGMDGTDGMRRGRPDGGFPGGDGQMPGDLNENGGEVPQDDGQMPDDPDETDGTVFASPDGMPAEMNTEMNPEMNGEMEPAGAEDIDNVSFSLADAVSYRTAGASKATPAFDVIDYGQEDYVFGSSEKDARHWDTYLLEILTEHADELSGLFNQ